MSASLKPLTVDEFLAWERAQELRFEFDGIQPVAMIGGSLAHTRTTTRLTIALGQRVQPPCEPLGPKLKVLTPGRVRYPDASIICSEPDEDSDIVSPTVVFEVLSPSTALTDRRVKAMEYAAVPSILAYVMLETDRPEATVRRRSAGWGGRDHRRHRSRPGPARGWRDGPAGGHLSSVDWREHCRRTAVDENGRWTGRRLSDRELVAHLNAYASEPALHRSGAG
jgi:Uma2 family endonuclease